MEVALDVQIAAGCSTPVGIEEAGIPRPFADLLREKTCAQRPWASKRRA